MEQIKRLRYFTENVGGIAKVDKAHKKHMQKRGYTLTASGYNHKEKYRDLVFEACMYDHDHTIGDCEVHN